MVRGGEYAARGDYHRTPDPDWDYYPTYLAKLSAVRAYLAALPRATRVLDAGCGEGILVEEFAGRLDVVGVDANYASARVTQGTVTALPFPDASFDRALCLDVLEHLSFAEQPQALAELFRVLKPHGELLVSVPNLAHLQSRVQFLLRGRLIRYRVGIQASRRLADRRIPRARAAGRLRTAAPRRHLPDRTDPDADDPEAAPGARAPAPRADPAAAGAGLVLLESADAASTLTPRVLEDSRALDQRHGVRPRRGRHAGRQLSPARFLRRVLHRR